MSFLLLPYIPSTSPCPPDGRRTISRHVLVKMCAANGAVGVTEDKSMTGRHLPAYGIGVQIDPWTLVAPVRVVSHFEAETADRNDILHGTLLGWRCRFACLSCVGSCVRFL